ncbi:type I-E CRISPR-associated protein Cas5/CasD [Marinospirillum alkaliphilum]|uniref:CRISPR system Cascade subunit CasD n=1 Tax=Marinospirillum alkaliphilum DSM 21637 TaxID=1122209 RepID=A0A1K1WA50_9GAMM|nr:type I-E CRISPR-associated protein Cas5/CasD [Marinospirillum alkaliphilum]SFX34258.1 CRISPR system Cascade subunit CasD [Marinospirillum alkaliphilum DSM 21637]
MEYLVFQLYGPLASWGETAIGETRPSGFYPSRSALIGLVAAALGVERSDAAAQEHLRSSLGFAVKTCIHGDLLRDYHTAQMPSRSKASHYQTRRDELGLAKQDLNTVLSSRDYRMDGFWVVALWLKQPGDLTLEALAEKLRKPVFMPYLGRKACPVALPFSPIQVAGSLRQALDSEFPPLLKSHQQDHYYLKNTQTVTYIWEGEADALGNAEQVQSRHVWDEPISRQPWQFGQRLEHQLVIREDTHVPVEN